MAGVQVGVCKSNYVLLESGFSSLMRSFTDAIFYFEI
ncbi:hypothetical protein BH24ACI3_BH24ACI3_05070 [soil metagenome]